MRVVWVVKIISVAQVSLPWGGPMGSPRGRATFPIKKAGSPSPGAAQGRATLSKKAAHVGDRRRYVGMGGWQASYRQKIIILLRNHKVKDLDLFCLLLPKKGCGHTNYHQCKWLRQVVYG